MFLQEAAQQIISDPMMTTALLPAQFTGSTMVVWAIDALKRANWFPWLSSQTDNLNRIAAIIGAGLTTAGIHWAIEPVEATGVYTLTITGISVMSVFHFVSGFMVSIATQQTILKLYQTVNTLRRIADK